LKGGSPQKADALGSSTYELAGLVKVFQPTTIADNSQEELCTLLPGKWWQEAAVAESTGRHSPLRIAGQPLPFEQCPLQGQPLFAYFLSAYKK
jgi:hypothetical protein